MSEDRRIIELRISNEKAYVWDVDDIAYLRSEYHVCGILTGTLPHVSQQNVFLGVPLILMPEEVVLLVTIGAAVLVDDPMAHLEPSIPQLEQWTREQQVQIQRQLAITETRSVKESDRANSEAAMRKRKEREEKKKATAAAVAAAKASSIAEEEEGQEQGAGDPVTGSGNFDAGSVLIPDLISTDVAGRGTKKAEGSSSSSAPSHPSEKDKSAALYTITIPASSTELPWYNSQANPSVTAAVLSEAKRAGFWTFPSNLHERARCGVFHDLWKQGYYLGLGIKFGGEYLVYPGDPLRYHSHFTATVIDSPVSNLKPMEIVAHGRLGTATKKSHLLCGWDDERKEVSYFSIEWAGFG